MSVLPTTTNCTLLTEIERERERERDMAKAKTSTFTIKHEMTVGTSPATEAIPIGSLIDVADAQALEIVSVDYVWQPYDTANDLYLANMDIINGTAGATVQLMDKNSSNFISAADNNMISSANLFVGASFLYSEGDFYPDDFKGDTGRFVVNDEMYLISDLQGTYDANRTYKVSVLIRAKVVKLSTRDWMAISLETVQNE